MIINKWKHEPQAKAYWSLEPLLKMRVSEPNFRAKSQEGEKDGVDKAPNPIEASAWLYEDISQCRNDVQYCNAKQTYMPFGVSSPWGFSNWTCSLFCLNISWCMFIDDFILLVLLTNKAVEFKYK